MVAKLARMTHKIAILLHLVAESCTFSFQAVSPETFGYTFVCCVLNCIRSFKCLQVVGNFVLLHVSKRKLERVVTMSLKLHSALTEHHAIKAYWGVEV
jgi:hypothetical protein